MHLSPAEYVIFIFGGVRATARAVRKDPGAICKWKRSWPDGCGGNVPGEAQRLILGIARRRKLDITPDDLMYGRRVNKKPLAQV